MSTVNHARLNNLPASVSNWMWSVSRALKKAGWKFKASSNSATKVSNGDPAADNWTVTPLTTNAGAAAASITAIANGRATVTGLTGIVAADKGRFLLISGANTGASNNLHQIEEVLSATSVRIDARQFAVVAPDVNNGALTWTIQDPLNEGIPNTGSLLWWCAQGPSILRIPITAASTGTFIRGENITQATTGATGELLGYTFLSGVGYLNVAPRLRGSGAGVHGWDTANLISGANSGATVTQVGTALEYVYEVVLSNPGSNSAQVLLGQFETVAEAAERFSFCATQAGCTAGSVHPGGGGTGNAFGAHAWVVWGTNSTPGFSVNLVATVSPVRAHVICADAIPEQGYSADGSWALIYSFITAGNPDGFSLLGLQRLNDIEEADFAPYVSINQGGVKTLYGQNRTSAGTTPTIAFSQGGVQALQIGTTRVAFNGWRRRGLSAESFAEFEPCILQSIQNAVFAQAVNAVDVTRIATSPDTTARVREPIWIISAALGAKVFKGTLKWIYVYAGEQATDVIGTDPAWVQLGNITPGTVIGPGDGVAWILN